MSATEGASYLDSSALVKLVVMEPETAALTAHARGRERMASSALALVEVVRAIRRSAPAAVPSAERVLEELDLIPVDDTLLRAAGGLQQRDLRSLDAIHVATAASLAAQLSEVITYDRRMASAAGALGLPVAQPA